MSLCDKRVNMNDATILGQMRLPKNQWPTRELMGGRRSNSGSLDIEWVRLNGYLQRFLEMV